MNRSSRIRFHWAMGCHSNLPRCCILWFCLVRVHLPGWWCRFQQRVETDWLGIDRPAKRSYARCPICFLVNRWAEQHICGPGCGRPRRVGVV